MNNGSRLSVGDVLNRVFQLYKEHFGVLIPVAFWLFLVVAILGGVLSRSNALALVIFFAASFAAAILYQGMVVSLVRDVQEGKRDFSVSGLFQSVGPVIGALIGASIFYGLAVGIGFFLLIIPGCILLTIWAVVAPVIVIERSPIFESFGRSREIVRGYGWPVFGTVIVATLIAAIVSAILGLIAEGIAGGPILRIVFGALASTLTAPIGALVASVLYYRLLEIKGAVASPGVASPADPPPTEAPPSDPPPRL